MNDKDRTSGKIVTEVQNDEDQYKMKNSNITNSQSLIAKRIKLENK